jgi:penicillin-binding protein 2
MPDPLSRPDKSPELERRIYGFFGLILVGFCILLASAYHLQVIRGGEYLALSEGNRMRTVEIAPPRGLIYDRNGVLLVDNAPSFTLYVVPGDLRDRDAIARRLSSYVDIAPDEILSLLKVRKDDAYLPVRIKRNLSLREVALIESHRLDLAGVSIQAEFKRNFVHGTLAAHLLGYIGEISKKQLDSGRYAGMKQGGVIGQYGVEQSYDPIIRGTPGKKWIEVDALGHEKKLIKIEQPIIGNDAYLTIDVAVQKAAEEGLGERAGAVVAIDPNSGEVLALTSQPAFNPNDLSVGISSATWKALTTDKARPLINRAIAGLYPPGSTYKVIMGAAILAAQKADAAESVHCPGFFPFGNRNFRDWKKEGHGRVALHRALVESCDVYFYKMATRLPIDTISHYSRLFGLGQKTGIPLEGENGGLIPSTEWKRRVRKEPWYPGETLSVAIGQGYVLTTPLQMATAIAAVASDGWWRPPQLLKKWREQTSETPVPPTKGERKIPMAHATLQVVRDGLVGVVAEPRGTAHASQSKLVSMAGKTGTAQVVVIKQGDSVRKKLKKEVDDHAWFVAYAPVEQPKIAVAVLVEHGGHGGSAAAPIAKKVVESYLSPVQESTQ